MEKKSFRGRVCFELINAAKLYKEKFVDYEYLICSEAFSQKEYYIVDAREGNFQHLTGVSSLISPKDFFLKCYEGTIEEDDLIFNYNGLNEKSVKGTIRRKIKVLPSMLTLFEKDAQAEEGFQKSKVSCSFATADNLCTLGFTETEKARPKTLIKGNELTNGKPVDLVLRKKKGTPLFNELTIGNKVTLKKYEDKIDGLLADNLKKLLR